MTNKTFSKLLSAILVGGSVFMLIFMCLIVYHALNFATHNYFPVVPKDAGAICFYYGIAIAAVWTYLQIMVYFINSIGENFRDLMTREENNGRRKERSSKA